MHITRAAGDCIRLNQHTHAPPDDTRSNDDGDGDDEDEDEVNRPNRRNTSNVVTKIESTIRKMHTHAWPELRSAWFTSFSKKKKKKKKKNPYSTSCYRKSNPTGSRSDRERLDTSH